MKKHVLIILGMIFLLAGCETVENVLAPDDNPSASVKKEMLSGHVQKGPFVNGSSVSVIELNAGLNQTGRIYTTSISDNSGSFEQKNVELVSNYIQLKADGYYFNEVTGKISSGQLSLTALADVSDANTVNVNVLTHLERARVEYLVQQKSLDFSEAKKQAQNEVAGIFGLSIPETTASESLDLTNNGLLLAVSCILQGPFSTGDMAELMADISSDIRVDGVLDNTALGTKLINNASAISLSAVRNNLEAKYAELGIDVTIPDFESYVRFFIDSDLYPKSSLITYPATGTWGDNILSDAVTSVVYWNNSIYYSMKADVPEGLSLKIVLRGTCFSYVGIPAPINWGVSQYNQTDQCQEFTVIESGRANDLGFLVLKGGGNGITNPIVDENDLPYILIEYYEGVSTTPTKVKKLYIEDPDFKPVPPCVFTNPLTDLPWIQEIIDAYANAPVYPGVNLKMEAKIYQCVYGAGKTGFVLDHVSLLDDVVDNQVKTLYDCSGVIVSSTGWQEGHYDSFNVRNEVLIYQKN